jgi:uncharacterized membrane protein
LWLFFLASAAWGNSTMPVEEYTHSGNSLYHGHLSISTKDSSFTQCNTGNTLKIIDRTGGELLQVYKELTYEPGAKVYVELLGRQDQLSEGLNKLTILKLRHAAMETRGCAEDLHGFSFRAAGNEPFWHIAVTNEEISFSEIGQPEIIFPPATPSVSDNHWHYSTKTADPSPQRLAIDIREKTCRDTMSGAFFSFNAQVRLDNREYKGCARQGWEQNRSMTIEDIKNAAYFSEWSSTGKVQLTNGIYREKIVPDSATELVIRLNDTIAFGDLNNDGVNEAAAILITDGGGSGTFRDLVVLTDCNGLPKHIATATLGDRVRVQSLSVQSGHILLEMITHGTDDPMASPSLQVRKQFKLQGHKLVLVDNN